MRRACVARLIRIHARSAAASASLSSLMQPPPRVAVVGGGAAGCAAAHALAQRGAAVTVYDTGLRGPGGRCSSRPAGDDHGCQVVAPVCEAVARVLSATGAAAPWDGRFGVLDAATQTFAPGGPGTAAVESVVPLTPPRPRGVWVGTPTAAALCTALAADCTLMRGHRVTAIAGPTVGPFDVTAVAPAPRGAAAGAPPPVTTTFDAVVLADASTVARPGAATAVHLSGGVEASAVVDTLKQSSRAPLFTATVTLPPSTSLPFDAAVVVNSPDVAAIIVDSAKPQRKEGEVVVVVISTLAAAAEWLALFPPPARPPPDAVAPIGARLWAGAAAAVPGGLPAPQGAPVVQRWGAGVETHRLPLSHAVDGRLAGCGDLFGGTSGDRTGADAALASGLAAGAAVADACGL